MRFRCALIATLSVAGSGTAVAQVRVVTGRVVDAVTKAVVERPTVTIVGSEVGTVGSADGAFVLRNVPDSSVTVLVRRLGYRRGEFILRPGQTTLDVELQPDVLGLEEVVVTGQATGIERRNLANSVSTLAAEDLTRVPSATIERTLQGKVPGANIQANSNAPGGGVQVELRGISSLLGGGPLYVVDGTIVSDAAIQSNIDAVTQASQGSNPSHTQDNAVNRIADLNPADIETVEILKGASAAAIYGSKASNGVIIITTKRGRPGALRTQVSQRFGVFDLARTLTRQYASAAEVDSALGPGTATMFNFDQNRNRNWEEDLAGHHPLSSETNVSLSGGTDDTRFFASGAVTKDGGIMPNTGFDRQSARVNLDRTLGARAELQLSTNLLRTLARRGISGNDNTGVSPWFAGLATPRFLDLRQRPDGTYPVNPFGQSNPLQTIGLLTNDEEVWRFIGSGRLDVDVLHTDRHVLRFIGVAGLDRFSQENTVYSPPEMQFEDDDGLPGTSALSDGASEYLNTNVNLVDEYTSSGGALRVTTSVGLQYDTRNLRVSRVVAKGLLEGQQNIDQGSNVQVEETRERRKDFGVYGQEEILFHDRLLLTAGLRADQSSSNSLTDKLFLYPKAAASYRWPLGRGVVDGIKLRMAYGESGKQPEFGQKFTPLDGSTRIDGILGFQVQGTTASQIKPERQREIEGGLDVTLWNGRASFEATIYRRSIADLLLTRALAPSSGFELEVFNGGSMRINGVEAALSLVPVQSQNTYWIVRSTFGLNRSKITDLPVPAFTPGPGNAGFVFGPGFGAFFIQEGASATQIVGNRPDGSGGSSPGKVGDTNPDFRVGFSNDLRWHDFDLFVQLDWQEGSNVINLTKLLFDLGNNFYDCTNGPDNPCAQRLATFSTDVRGTIVEDATFLKVREITLSWDLPVRLTPHLFGGASTARIVASARNWFTFTGYTGMDPEVSNFGNQAIGRNVDTVAYPRTRSFWFGFDLGF